MLTVTADDFGIGYETSRGIVDCHLAGAVHATSVMVTTGEHLDRSLPLLERAPGLRLGLHLMLTSRAGRLLVAGKSSGLVDRDGGCFSLGSLYARCKVGMVSAEAIRAEVLAQVERFVKQVGRAPAHLDAHHHAHQLPVVRAVLAELLEKRLVPGVVRNSVEAPWSKAVPGDRARRWMIDHLGRRARPWFEQVGAQMPDGFTGALTPAMLATANPFAPYLNRLPAEGTWEMMVHPGYLDESLRDRDTYIEHRVTELKALVSHADSPLF